MSHRRLIWNLAWPAILEMLLHTLVWTFDTAMVGRLGAEALSAVGMGAQFLWATTFFFGAIGIGTSAMVSRSVGAGEPGRARNYAEQAYALGFLLGGAVWLLLRHISPLGFALARMGPEVTRAGMEYTLTAAPGAVFAIPLFVSNATMRAWGNTRTPLYITGTANLVNIVLDYVLIFGKAGAPSLGVRGAALATVIAQAVGLGLASVALFDPQGNYALRPLRALRPAPRQLTALAKVSAPAALEGLLMDGARTVGLVLVGALGTVPFAANEVALAAESLSFMPGYGFAVAAGILTGQNLGAKKPERARGFALETVKLCVLTMSVVGLSFLLFPKYILRFFTPEAAVVSTASVALRIAALEQPAVAAAETLAGSLRGAGDTRTPMWVTALSAWGIRVPLIFLAVRVLGLGLPWVWGITVLDWSFRAALLSWHFNKGRWLR